MTYEQAFEYVGSFTKSGTPVKDLIRFVILMRLLGNPQNELKIVHVAGRRQRSEPQELTLVGDWGERGSPQLRREICRGKTDGS